MIVFCYIHFFLTFCRITENRFTFDADRFVADLTYLCVNPFNYLQWAARLLLSFNIWCWEFGDAFLLQTLRMPELLPSNTRALRFAARRAWARKLSTTTEVLRRVASFFLTWFWSWSEREATAFCCLVTTSFTLCSLKTRFSKCALGACLFSSSKNGRSKRPVL